MSSVMMKVETWKSLINVASKQVVENIEMTERVTVSDKRRIQQKIYQTLRNDDEKCEKMLQFLEDPELKRITESCWLLLKNARPSNNSFQKCCEVIIEEMEEISKNKNMATILENMNRSFLEATEECSNNGQGLKLGGKDALNALKSFSFSLVSDEFINAVAIFLSSILKKIGVREILSLSDEAASVVSKSAKNGITAILVGIYALWMMVTSVIRFRKGEITKNRLKKILVDETIAIVGGAVCGILFTPIGGLIGSIIGSVLGTLAFGKASDLFTQWLFGIPGDELLENAYVFFGLTCYATDNEVNTAYRKKCLEYHPDKPNGNAELFHKCQVHFHIIKESREKKKKETEEINQTQYIETSF